MNQPGRTQWEGFATGTLAAISGGVTTLIDMPLNSIPPTTTVEHLEIKRASAKDCGVYTDVGFWGGIIPGNAEHLKPLLEAGVKGFKCFLIESGVDVSPIYEISTTVLISGIPLRASRGYHCVLRCLGGEVPPPILNSAVRQSKLIPGYKRLDPLPCRAGRP
jgi:dihydroorotase-like cyclic amidohydrolase